ncbi:MAG: hypothetical protein SVU94_08915 [Bacteroidota bacterium]|nr:hypothetical protein [Bacteroidota bacterium]
MKKLLFTLTIVFFTALLIKAQTPNQFKYQATLRNSDGSIMAEENVDIDIKILEGSESGTAVFTETHNVTTTAYGVVSLNVGSTEDLTVVNWGDNDYFLEISVDGTVIGTSQILSVPYTLYSKNSNQAESILLKGGIMKDFLEVQGTTDPTDPYLYLDYPEGYYKYNTRVLSFEVQYMGQTWMGIGRNGEISVGLGETSIYLYYTDAATYKNKPFRLIIAKVEI